MDTEAGPSARMPATIALIAVWGPGLLVMLADTDAGNVVTAAQAGTLWGYRLLPLLLLLIPLLYVVQELTVRLGIFTGRGYGELVRARFGPAWAWIAAVALIVATVGSLVTEFTGIAGVGELYGVPRHVTLPLAVACLMAVVLTGAYRRVERTAIVIGLFELAFFFVAWKAHPSLAAMAHDMLRPALGDRGFLYLVAALIGAVFNPWMVFYQQSAIATRGLTRWDYRVARWDTAIGAALTQLLTAAVLVAAAATIRTGGAGLPLGSIGEISAALTPFLGGTVGRLVFSVGVVGASIVAAIVCSLALAWGLGEVAGNGRPAHGARGPGRWFYAIYSVGVFGGCAIVWVWPDLVVLNIAAQVVNAVLLPLVVGLLVALAVTVLPPARRPRGWYLWVVIATLALVSVAGLAGAVAGFG